MQKLAIEDITKRYGRTVAVDNVSFACAQGEFFSILGASGAGKSTLLKTVAGIVKPDAGRVLLDGGDVTTRPIQERNVAMAFENYSLYPQMKVYENIAFPLRAPTRPRRLSPTEEREKVVHVAKILSIEPYLDRLPGQLSGGQRQRVSLARAMVREPNVFLLDEPLAHLDAKLKFQTRTRLKQLALEIGATTLYVTHDFREALSLSDRILILREGRIEQIGTPKEIYHQPATDFVAALVGDPPMNLIDGRLRSEGGRLRFEVEDAPVPIVIDLPSAQATVNVRDDGLVRLGCRPGDVRYGTGATSGAVRLPVYAVEHSAEASLLSFSLGHDRIVQAQVPGRVTAQVGEPIEIGFPADRLFLFRKTFELGEV
ncbi:MAG TPA: ABC transporter ATP-binding protein [Geminicoccus sp.]|jgi:ABC-type sugar transport system ATPase subunit|uniref:ABC transporter ATP-binding protein n=1 Tax=Geminicoccus sp. TaxID=2024832 RepID=UPI002E345AB1|nr:ABC transporter ATP-binding protein [Geminicoccus sp.]HEX2528161.1 ABC transporter ATP-binding protein [Geminicoccus sp.]